MDDREERIRRRAHALWEQEGRPDNREQYHWELAADLVDREDTEQRAARAGNGSADGDGDQHEHRGTDGTVEDNLPGKPPGPPEEVDPDPAEVPEKYYADQGDLPGVTGQIQISQGVRKKGEEKSRPRGSGTTKPRKGS